MRVVRTLILLGGLALLPASLAFGADIYVAQNTSGSDSGVDCANAHSAAWFNANAVGGNTYHLCGTFTGTAGSTMLTPPSGSAGNILTVLFETGAILTAPAWGSTSAGAIKISSKSYVTIDGGTNGVIQNSANGTGLAYSQASQGIFISSPNHIEIKNLTIQNIYANGGSSPTATDTGGQTTADIYVVGSASDIFIHNNVLNNARSGVRFDWDKATLSNIQIYKNYIYDHCWDVVMGSGSTPDNATGVLIHDNEMTGWWNWQCPATANYCNNNPVDLYHTDGIILFQPLGNPNVFAPLIYNNYIHGDLGQGSATAFIYATYGGGSGASNNLQAQIFNNLLVQVKDVNRTTNNGVWVLSVGTGTGPSLIVNNTLAGWGGNTTRAMVNTSSGDTVENNIIQNVGHAMDTYWSSDPTPAVTGWTVDRNVWYNISPGVPGQWAINESNGHFYSYATWQSWGYDATSVTTDPVLTSNYILGTGSSAIALATNFTTLCTGNLVALCTDKAGVARPTSGAWDAGAYQSSATNRPNPPVALRVTSVK